MESKLVTGSKNATKKRQPGFGGGLVFLCIIATLFAGSWAASNALAADWLTWRGPNRDGRVHDFKLPAAWPDKPTQVWQSDVGTGHASPLVQGDHVFLLSREGDNEVVRCVKLSDGAEVWSKNYPAPYKVHPAATAHGKGPRSTPALADGQLFTLGINSVMTAWDAKTGKQLWQRDFSERFKHTSPLYGTSTSPLINDDVCIAYVGGDDDGALIAFDRKTGETRWEYTDDGPSYASPVITTIGGTRQLITQSRKYVLGLSASTGKLLWQEAYRTRFDQNSVTPLVIGDRVIIGGFRQGITCYRIRGRGRRFSVSRAWHTDDASMYMSSPVVSRGQIYGHSQNRKGQLFCIDVGSGNVRWLGDGRLADNAALLIVGETIVTVTTDSELIVFKADAAKYSEVARYEIADDEVWAHPALTDRGILIKDEQTLALWSLE